MCSSRLANRSVNDLNVPANTNGRHHAHSMPPLPFEKPVPSRTACFWPFQSHKTLLRSVENTHGYEWGDDWVRGERHVVQMPLVPLVE